MAVIERRLADECDRYGLPHDFDALMRHLRGSHEAIVGAKDVSIAALDRKLAGAIEDARDAGEASMQAAFWRARAIELGASEDEYQRKDRQCR